VVAKRGGSQGCTSSPDERHGMRRMWGPLYTSEQTGAANVFVTLDAREKRQGYAHEKWTTSRLLSDHVELACDPRRQDFREICP
jgi:hypothetical protein